MSTRAERHAAAALADAGIIAPSAGILRAAVRLEALHEDEASARECRDAAAELARMIAEAGEAESDDDAEAIAGVVLDSLRTIDRAHHRAARHEEHARYGGRE